MTGELEGYENETNALLLTQSARRKKNPQHLNHRLIFTIFLQNGLY